MPTSHPRCRPILTTGIAAGLAAALLLTSCADDKASVFAPLPSADYLPKGTDVWIDATRVGSIAHLREGKSGGQVARLAIRKELLKQLDENTLWIVRTEQAGGSRKVILATNLCVDGPPRGIPDNTEVKLLAGPMHTLLNGFSKEHGDCAKRLGEAAFAKFRASVQAPLGTDPMAAAE